MKKNSILFASERKGRIFTPVITTTANKMKATFKKIEAGKYNLLLNGEVLATVSKGTYTWSVYNQTEAFTSFYEKLDRYHNWMIEGQSYDTKAELKECFQCAANSLNA